MRLIEFRRGALNDACRSLAKCVYPGSMELSSDLVETMAHKFEEVALAHIDFITGQDRDPNIVTRAVCYLRDVHAIPPMGTDVVWFENMLICAIELAVPNSACSNEAFEFLADIQQGLVESVELAKE